MPSKSKKQRRLMCGVCHGTIKVKGLSKKTACEFCSKDIEKSATGLSITFEDIFPRKR